MELFESFWTFAEIYEFWIDGWFWLFEQFLTPFVVVLENIPAPAFANNMGSLTLPSGVAWFASALELPTGASIMASAWTLRFVIRRLPFIG